MSVGMLCAAVGFAIGLAIGRGRQPRWAEKGSFVHKVSIGFATLDRLDAVLLRFEVEADSRLAGVEVAELRLPEGSSVSLVTRGPQVLVPAGARVAHRRPGARRRPPVTGSARSKTVCGR